MGAQPSLAAITDAYPSRIRTRPERLPRQDPVVWGSGSNGPLDASACEHFQDHGFLNIPQLFNADEVAGLYAAAERLRAQMGERDDPRLVREPGGKALRSIFQVHALDAQLSRLFRMPRLLDRAMQLLGGPVYLHQTRVNFKPGFTGKEFYWHSDFETWHVEDGMPRMRAVSCAISLTDNHEHNGPLLLIPGSHRHFLACVGATPENHYQQSLRRQEYGVPDADMIAELFEAGGLRSITGAAGGVVFFDCNLLHGSNSNISPLPRANLFAVYNSVHNRLCEPTCGLPPRPGFIAEREPAPALQAAADLSH